MTSLVRTIRDWIRGIPKDAPLDYSQITSELYVGAWPTKYNVDMIQSLGVTAVLSTILESVDKELGQSPLQLVKMRMTDAIPNRPHYPTKTLMRGVDAALAAFERGEKVMVFWRRSAMERIFPALVGSSRRAKSHVPPSPRRTVIEPSGSSLISMRWRYSARM